MSMLLGIFVDQEKSERQAGRFGANYLPTDNIARRKNGATKRGCSFKVLLLDAEI